MLTWHILEPIAKLGVGARTVEIMLLLSKKTLYVFIMEQQDDDLFLYCIHVLVFIASSSESS